MTGLPLSLYCQLISENIYPKNNTEKMSESKQESATASPSKVIHYNSLETIRFEYEATYDRFSTRTQEVDSPPFGPPARNGLPELYLKMEPNYNNYVRFSVYVKSSTRKITLRTQCWLVEHKNGQKWNSASVYLLTFFL